MNVNHFEPDEVDLLISALQDYKDIYSLTCRFFGFPDDEIKLRKGAISRILYKLYYCQDNLLNLHII